VGISRSYPETQASGKASLIASMRRWSRVRSRSGRRRRMLSIVSSRILALQRGRRRVRPGEAGDRTGSADGGRWRPAGRYRPSITLRRCPTPALPPPADR
jgi:hypothetical protein